MTVKKLIKILSRVDENSEVFVSDWNGWIEAEVFRTLKGVKKERGEVVIY